MNAPDTPTTFFTMTMPLTIRAMSAEDLQKLEWYGQYRHFRNVFARSYHDQAMGKRHLLVADFNGFPIGRLFILLRSRNLVVADGKHRAYLYSFAVLDMFQSMGIGSHLIRAAEEVLIERGFSTATLAVAKENDGALRLYQRHHYRIFAEDDGRWRYTDHRGVVRQVVEPAWLLEKTLLQNTNDVRRDR
jgi:ribosomal protein S18 acetylase RimI-like enzyme